MTAYIRPVLSTVASVAATGVTGLAAYAIGPQKVAVAAVAGLVTALAIHVLANKKASADNQENLIDGVTVLQGAALLNQKFAVVQKVTAFLSSIGFVQTIAAKAAGLAKLVPFSLPAVSAPAVTGFSFGVAAGNLLARSFYVIKEIKAWYDAKNSNGSSTPVGPNSNSPKNSPKNGETQTV